MRALSILILLASTAHAQPAKKITVGIYAPSIEFASSTARVGYVQALAKAIAQNTGLEVDAVSYANVAALKKDNVDYAIIDGPCYATNLGWKLLATATINGATTRPYALYATVGTMKELENKKLSFIQAGCNDAGFIDNAMLDSEVPATYWSARVGKADLGAAIAEVAQAKTSQAVFAPVGAPKGLTKVFDTGPVPNPAFVEIGAKQPAAVVDKIAAAVISFGQAGGAIGGWTKPTRDIYTSFTARLGKSTKQPIMAAPEPARIDAKDVLIEPPTIKDFALVGVRHHFVRAPGERME